MSLQCITMKTLSVNELSKMNTNANFKTKINTGEKWEINTSLQAILVLEWISLLRINKSGQQTFVKMFSLANK